MRSVPCPNTRSSATRSQRVMDLDAARRNIASLVSEAPASTTPTKGDTPDDLEDVGTED